jgi:hypothetical protein
MSWFDLTESQMDGEPEPMRTVRRDAVAPDGRVFRTIARVPARPLTDAELEAMEADIAKAQRRFLAHYFPHTEAA